MLFISLPKLLLAKCNPLALTIRTNLCSTKSICFLQRTTAAFIPFDKRSSKLIPSKTYSVRSGGEMSELNKEELKKKLTPLQYQVTQEKGTERPFTGEYDKFYEEGMYSCIVCGQQLFSSKTKFDSGCGWPAFNDVLDQGLVKLSKDTSLAPRIRTEVQCSKCDAHMGHVFDDGPKPTGKRFCINSASIVLTEKNK